MMVPMIVTVTLGRRRGSSSLRQSIAAARHLAFGHEGDQDLWLLGSSRYGSTMR